jgi:hypothetical protein
VNPSPLIGLEYQRQVIARGVEIADPTPKPFLESAHFFIARGIAVYFGDRLETLREFQALAREGLPVDAEEHVGRSISGTLAPVQEGLALGDAHGQDDGLADEVRPFVPGRVPGPRYGRLEFILMDERARPEVGRTGTTARRGHLASIPPADLLPSAR